MLKSKDTFRKPAPAQTLTPTSSDLAFELFAEYYQ